MVVDPGPFIRARIAEETAPLRAELAEATTPTERLRIRGRILALEWRIRRQFRGGGTVKF